MCGQKYFQVRRKPNFKGQDVAMEFRDKKSLSESYRSGLGEPKDRRKRIMVCWEPGWQWSSQIQFHSVEILHKPMQEKISNANSKAKVDFEGQTLNVSQKSSRFYISWYHENTDCPYLEKLMAGRNSSRLLPQYQEMSVTTVFLHSAW